MKMISAFILLTFITQVYGQVSTTDFIPEQDAEAYTTEAALDFYKETIDEQYSQNSEDYIQEEEEIVDLDPELLE